MRDLETRKGLVFAGGVTGARDVITSKSMMRWLVEGKIFSAGVGYENAGIDDDADTKEDLTPTAGLVCPSSGDVYILPILARMNIHTEGGNVPRIACTISRAAEDVVTSLFATGTAMPSIHNHNSKFTNKPNAKALYNLTSSAMTEPDFIMLELAQAADNPTSGTTDTGLAFTKGTVWELNLLSDPYLLSSGAALYLYPNTNTGRTKYCPYITWAELTLDDIY